MTIVNMLEAKTNLSKLVEAVESGAEAEVILARNGRPAARIVPLAGAKPRVKIGYLNGKYDIGDPDPELDAAIARMFGVDG